MAKKPKKPKTPQDPWEPSVKDAINLSTLRFYALTIESLIILNYRSDPDASRPRLPRLKKMLVRHIDELRSLGTEGVGPGERADCPDPEDTRCSDGFCYPPPGCLS